MKEIEELNETIASAYMELTLAVKEIKEVRLKNGLPDAVYDVKIEDLVSMVNTQGEKETKEYIIDQLSEDDEAKAVRAFNRITDKKMNCFVHTREEIEEEIRQKVEEELSINGISAEIEYIVITGSRSRGINSAESDIDILVQYKGDITEDAMKNMLDTSFKDYRVEGVSVDIMPYSSSKYDISNKLAEMEEYMASPAEQYKRELAAGICNLSAGSFKYYDIRAAIDAPSTDSDYNRLMMRLESIHAAAKKENPLSFKALKSGEYLTWLRNKSHMEKSKDIPKKEEKRKTR